MSIPDVKILTRLQLEQITLLSNEIINIIFSLIMGVRLKV